MKNQSRISRDDAKSSALKALAGIDKIVSISRQVDEEALHAIRAKRAIQRTSSNKNTHSTYYSGDDAMKSIHQGEEVQDMGGVKTPALQRARSPGTTMSGKPCQQTSAKAPTIVSTPTHADKGAPQASPRSNSPFQPNKVRPFALMIGALPDLSIRELLTLQRAVDVQIQALCAASPSGYATQNFTQSCLLPPLYQPQTTLVQQYSCPPPSLQDPSTTTLFPPPPPPPRPVNEGCFEAPFHQYNPDSLMFGRSHSFELTSPFSMESPFTMDSLTRDLSGVSFDGGQPK